MKEIPIKSWQEFVAQVEEMHLERINLAKKSNYTVPELFYRGQPDAGLKLETTLERAIKGEISVFKYYAFVSIIKCKIEIATGRTWLIPTLEEVQKSLESGHPLLFGFPGYEYLAYLRHHGFPSPLLDWSRSPYVAALFAMEHPPQEKINSVSVYIYHGSRNGFRCGDVNSPSILSPGSYVNTHKRHYLQQSEYTICTNGSGLDLSYASHEKVFDRDDPDQDLLWKLIIRFQNVRHLSNTFNK